jgi:hypothetical protein
MNYDPTFDLEHNERRGLRGTPLSEPRMNRAKAWGVEMARQAKQILELEARLPRSKYPLERLSSTRLIAWWDRTWELWHDCHQLVNRITGYTRFQVKELQTECHLQGIDIEELLKARGYVRRADDTWYSAEDDKYQRWLEGLDDRQLKFQHELAEWDERRDES